MIIIHIGIKHLVQLFIRLSDLGLILLQLHIDLVNLFSHGMIFVQNFIQLFSQTSEKLPEQGRILPDLVNIKFGHDLRQLVQHGAGIIQLRHVHTVQNHIGSLGDLLCHLCSERNDRLQIIDLDLAGQRVHLRGTRKRRIHLLPVCNDVVFFHYLHSVFRFQNCGLHSCLRSVKIKAHTQLPLLNIISRHERRVPDGAA